MSVQFPGLTIAQTCAKLGVPYDSFFDRYSQSFWQSILSASQPAGPQPADCSWTVNFICCHLVARGLIYWRNKPGDCGTQNASGTVAPLVGKEVSGSLALATGITGAVVGATATATIALGAATAGIGLLLAPILAIVEHHAAAVQNEQNTICTVAGQANQAIPQIDALVRSGQITAAQGLAALKQVITNLKLGLNPVSGQGSSGHPCNAGCCYQAVCDAHVLFAATYYNDIAPVPVMQPPTSYQVTAPASTAAAQEDLAVVQGVAGATGSPVIVGSPVRTIVLSTPNLATTPVNAPVMAASGAPVPQYGFLLMIIAAVIGLILISGKL